MGVLQKKYELGKLEVAFIIIIFVALVGAGFYAWHLGRNKQRSINSFAECVAAGNPVMESYPEQCAADGRTFTNPDQAVQQPSEVTELDSTEDWATYTGFAFTLRHPADWHKDARLASSSAEADIVSSDFVEAEDLGPSVKAGYWLEVYRFTDNKSYTSYDEHLAALQNTEQGCGGSYETGRVAELPAIISDIKCHGTYRYAYFYIEGDEYMIRLNGLDEDTDEFKQLFATILSTVTLSE